MRKEEKKEETERERMEHLGREYSDIDCVGLYNTDKLLWQAVIFEGEWVVVIPLPPGLSHHKITCK